VQVIDGALRVGGGGEDRAVVLQDLQPKGDVRGVIVTDLRGEFEIGAEKRFPVRRQADQIALVEVDGEHQQGQPERRRLQVIGCEQRAFFLADNHHPSPICSTFRATGSVGSTTACGMRVWRARAAARAFQSSGSGMPRVRRAHSRMQS